MNMTPNTLSPVPFHGTTLFVVEKDGEPFAPMKPIVEGMGLAWQAQHAKISANIERWSITNIVTVAEDGKDREVVCMPVRKLPAWLSSINPKKVRPEIRETVVTYQNECDDALWNYWTKGEAKRGDFNQPAGELPPWKNVRFSIPKRIAMFLDANPGDHHNSKIDYELGLTTRNDKLARTKAVKRMAADGLIQQGRWPHEWSATPGVAGRIHSHSDHLRDVRREGSPVTDSDLAVRFGQMSAAKATFMDASADVFRSIKRKFEFAPNDYAYPERSEAVQTTYATEAAFYALDRVLDCIESLTKAAAYRQ